MDELKPEEFPLQYQDPQDPESATVPPLDLAPTNKEWAIVFKWSSFICLVGALLVFLALAWTFGYLTAPESVLVYKIPPPDLSNATKVNIHSQGYYELKTLKILKDCHDHLKSKLGTGIYKINPDGGIPFFVFCEQAEDDGGWIVIQRRSRVNNSKQLPFRDYTHYDYEFGFGNLSDNHWLGLGYLRRIAPNVSSSMVMKIIVKGSVVSEMDYKKIYAEVLWEGVYGFWLDDSESGFTLHLRNTLVFGNLTGQSNEKSWNIVDNGRSFLARDGQGGDFNWCAEEFGGWWHHPDNCSPLSLNGDYQKLPKDTIFGWRNATHRIEAPLETLLLVRPQYHFPYSQQST